MTRLQASLLGAFLLTACDAGSAPGAAADAGAKHAGANSGAQETAASAPGSAVTPTPGPAAGELGTVSKTALVDLAAFVHKTPEEIEAVLGEPEATGTDRISCVRFVPERVFFACKQEIRTYAHPEFEGVRIEYEDGHAALVALTGLPGAGAFEPASALASVGISLPGEPRYRSESVASKDGGKAKTAQIWEWGNSAARLVLDGQQQRVRLSVVDEDWARSKLELINNQPLNDEQSARIKLPRTAEAPASQASGARAPAN